MPFFHIFSAVMVKILLLIPLPYVIHLFPFTMSPVLLWYKYRFYFSHKCHVSYFQTSTKKVTEMEKNVRRYSTYCAIIRSRALFQTTMAIKAVFFSRLVTTKYFIVLSNSVSVQVEFPGIANALGYVTISS